MQTQDLRDAFLGFFANKGHTIVPSSSVIPSNDPTLLFTNAGMNQFKDVFTGVEKREYTKATTAQKCIRAGGKHNDLEQVGYTKRHHTFFEMLGNFSFGDYFKEEAIVYAWDFVHKQLALPKDRLHITVHACDEEAANIWRKVAGDINIIALDSEDNFWSMGDVGPCGPCSEIFYDHGDHVFGSLPGTEHADGDRFMEIWNLVFMQYEKMSDGSLCALEKKSIDTGMGIERMSAVLNGYVDNYDIDIFQHIMSAIEDVASIKQTAENRFSFKVLADHVRASAFLISEGVLPSNEGRGYVLRRIIRRAQRYAYMLGAKHPVLSAIIPSVRDTMAHAYPQLEQHLQMIIATVAAEEERFQNTLEHGSKLLHNELQKKPQVLSGEIAFKLYDTYGFPLDLTREIAISNGISVDEHGFEECMRHQQSSSKWQRRYNNDDMAVWYEIRQRYGATQPLYYDQQSLETSVLAIVQDGQLCDSVAIENTAQNDVLSRKCFVVLQQSVFYPESGGQCGDIGELRIDDAVAFRVTNTHTFVDGLIVLEGEAVQRISVEQRVTACINAEHRREAAKHHSATHLLHAALKRVLGEHVAQKGSQVDADRLRLDFNCAASVDDEQVAEIEAMVNEWVEQDADCVIENMPKEDAMKSGACALFEEKYADVVRVVSFCKGKNVYSKELCCGTHVAHLRDIGPVFITSVHSIASGIKRLEAVVGQSALRSALSWRDVLRDISHEMQCPPEDVLEKYQHQTSAARLAQKQIVHLQKELLLQTQPEMCGNNIVYINKHVPASSLKDLVDQLRKKHDGALVIVLSELDNKTHVMICGNASHKASDFLKKICAALGGNGGGKDSFATGCVPASLRHVCESLHGIGVS